MPFAILAAAPALSAVFCWALIHMAPKDAPDGGRKDQPAPVPTSGGLAIAASLFAALALKAIWPAGSTQMGLEPGLVAAFSLCLFVLILGALDDARPVSTPLKFGSLAMAAIVAACFGVRAETVFFPIADSTLVLPAVLAIGGTALWIFVYMNALNFMDGSNGLAVGCATLQMFTLAIAFGPGTIWQDVSLLAGLSCIGFLAWNLPGKLFAGDAGALFLGAAFATLGLVAARGGNIWFPATLALPILIDVLLTLAWRARAGLNLLEPHRDHAYQTLRRSGWGHLQTAILWWSLSLICCTFGLWAYGLSKSASFWVFAGLLTAGTLLWFWNRRRLSQTV
ncbi:MAG: hypothetical protein AAGK23_07530 [Pseudomonadota bacterium]